MRKYLYKYKKYDLTNAYVYMGERLVALPTDSYCQIGLNFNNSFKNYYHGVQSLNKNLNIHFSGENVTKSRNRPFT